MSEDCKVVTMNGERVWTRGEPCQVVITALEEMLDRARKGEICAVGIAYVMAGAGNAEDQSVNCTYAHGMWTSYDLEVSIRRLQREFEHYIFDT